MRAGLEEVAVRVSVWLSPGPAEMPESGTPCVGASSAVVMSLMGLSVGGSLTGATVRTKEVFVAPPLPSFTVIVIVVAPN